MTQLFTCPRCYRSFHEEEMLNKHRETCGKPLELSHDEYHEIISDLLSCISVPDEPTMVHAVMTTAEQRLRDQADQIERLRKIVSRAREVLGRRQ